MISLFTNFYAPADPTRRAELEECLRRNLDNPHIDRVVALAQSDLPSVGMPNWHKSITLHIDCSTNPYDRPTFRDYFAAVNRMITCSTDLSIVANSDIYFDDSIGLIKQLDLGGICMALTRWDVAANGLSELLASENSQDSWIFQGPVHPLGVCNFPMGVGACDNRLAWELTKAEYRVVNPVHDVRSHHLHFSGVRDWKERIPGPITMVEHKRLADCGLQQLVR